MGNIFVKNKGFYRTLVVLALPVVIQNMITIGVNIMDTVMLGSFGEVQLSGSSLANDFINLFHIFCMGVGGGAAVLSAQFFGREDYHNVKKTVAIMLRFILILALICSLMAIFIPGTIMSIYTKDAEVIEKGIIYLRWSVPTFIMMGISLTLTLILRSIRDVKVPLYTSFGSFVINVFFNWVFIFGHLGAPRMEIAGAALGTVIARAFEAIAIGGYFLFKEKVIQFRIKDFFMNTSDLVATYFKFSVPVILSDSLLGFGNTMVSVVIGHIGTSFVAANSIIMMIQRLCTVMTQGLGQASSVLTGNSVGARNTEKAYAEGKTMIALGFILGVIAALIILAVGPFVINSYNISEETIHVAYDMLYAVSIMVIFQSLQAILTKGILRGGGDTKYVMFADAFFLWVVSIPLGWFTGVTLGLNAFIVYICLKIDWILKDILCMKRFLSKKWIKIVEQ